MPRLPAVSGKKAITALLKAGFVRIRQRGSHIVVQKRIPEGTRTVVVPSHAELAKGTLRSIIRKSGLTLDEFVKLL